MIRLAKQGILVSERQMEAFLTPSLSPSLDGSIDFSTFVNLARPRAPMPTPTPSYVRKADFSANATGGTVGYSAKVSVHIVLWLIHCPFTVLFQEGYGPFGLVDETYSEAQRDPLVTSQHVAFTRASNTLPSGQSLTEASATGTNPLRAAADEVCSFAEYERY